MILTAALGLFADRRAVTVTAVVLIGLVGVPMNPAMATRVMRIVGARPLVNTVHTAVINIGIAIGPWIGGLAISAGSGLRAPAWVGAGLATAGLLTLLPFLRHQSGTARTPPSEHIYPQLHRDRG
jgi:predicted MFS family arabinose efflux permease